MQTLFDAYVSFPTTSEYSLGTLDRLMRLCDSVEQMENYFNIEFSCGDGKFYLDFHYNWDQYEKSYGTGSEEDVKKYDGKVCYESLPRFNDTGELFKPNEDYNFTIKSKEVDDGNELTFYINGQKRNTFLLTP
jgi:hypothetical protein